MVLNTTEQKDYNYNIRQINKKITPLTDLYFHSKHWNKERKERKYPSDKEYINFKIHASILGGRCYLSFLVPIGDLHLFNRPAMICFHVYHIIIQIKTLVSKNSSRYSPNRLSPSLAPPCPIL